MDRSSKLTFIPEVMMRILATNDDGIYAPGLWAMVEELKEVGQVIVVAPDRDQSGTSASFSWHEPIRVRIERTLVPGVQAYAVEGTPVDSMILASKAIIEEKIDLVVSGINEGANLGNDTFFSGTVAAARQGYFYGIPSLAIAVDALSSHRFDVSAKLVRLLAIEIGKGTLPGKLLLNVNVPNLALEEIKGIMVTRPVDHTYYVSGITANKGKGILGKDYYWFTLRKPTRRSNKKGTDLWALKRGMISITPLFSDATSPVHDLLAEAATKVFHRL